MSTQYSIPSFITVQETPNSGAADLFLCTGPMPAAPFEEFYDREDGELVLTLVYEGPFDSPAAATLAALAMTGGSWTGLHGFPKPQPSDDSFGTSFGDILAAQIGRDLNPES